MAGLPCAVTLAHQAVSMVGGSPATSLQHAKQDVLHLQLHPNPQHYTCARAGTAMADNRKANERTLPGLPGRREDAALTDSALT